MPLGPIELNINLNTIPAATPTTPLPSNVYEVSTDVYQMTFSQDIWLPPRESGGYYNYIISDPGAVSTPGSYIAGRGTVSWAGVGKIQGFLNIPNGWKATKIFIDLRLADGGVADGVGNYAVRSISMYEVKTVTTDETIDADYAHVSLGNTTTNTVYTLSTEMVGKIDNAMWIRFTDDMTTVQFIGGGYITLERV
jgi:hypothetical protein